jgi:catechol 2,3-dioxygenase-like lactoylglutathione lyase family enzyme
VDLVMSAATFLGPLLSVADLDVHRALFEGVLGLRARAEQELSRAAVERLWGVKGRRARTVWLTTPGTRAGVRLVRFEPPAKTAIRRPERGQDADALKVVDFYTPDFDAATDRLAAAGFHLREERAEYRLESGRFREGHLWAPDGVVCGFIGGPRELLERFVTVTARPFSEVMSVSGPVSELEPALRFYQDVLGLAVVYRYEIDDPSFGGLVGTDQTVRLRAFNVGRSTREPYLGVVHYGLPRGSYRSLRDRGRPPLRGIAGACFEVVELDEVLDSARRAKAVVVAGPREAELAPWGAVRTLSIRGPHGVHHHAVERRDARR